MGVCPFELIIYVLQQLLGLALGIRTVGSHVGSHQGGQVELKSDIQPFLLFVILRLQIDVAFGVCQYGGHNLLI